MTATCRSRGDVVEAVGRDETVELGEIQRTGQVGVQRRVLDVGEARAGPAASFARSARASRSTATIRPPGPSRSARASVNAPSPAPMSAHVPPGSTAARSRPT